MKLALVTTSPGVPSAIGEYTRALLPHLRERCEVAVFVEPGADPGEHEEFAGAPAAPITALDPREHERVLFQLGNEPAQAFMPPVVRAIGGTVMLHHWALRDLTAAAYPALSQGGLSALTRAVREGGLAQARALLARRAAPADAAAEEGERPESGVELTLNRSIVRHADSFFVHSRKVGERIRDDRNAPTAIALIPRVEPGAEDGDWDELARVVVGHLEHYPGPRTTRGARVAFGAWKSGLAARVKGA